MRRIIPILLLLLAAPCMAQSLQFIADITQADGEAKPTLSWDTTPLAADCVASGDWSGAKGAAGSEVLPTITASATYSLACTWPMGSATLSWTAPTQNTDGTPLTDLAAYKFYYGTAPGDYSDMVRVDNPGITTYIIDNLLPATYYFVATAINDAGIESLFSNEAIKTVSGSDVLESVTITINPAPEAITDFAVQ